MRMLRILAGLILMGLLSLSQAQALAPVPPLTARVMDMAGLLTAAQKAALENVLQTYEGRTGNQIGVLLIDSSAPEVIEQYSIRVADAWKLGRKGIDDGVILVVAKNNPKDLRRLRIEAGRGVQGTVTDAQSKRILQDVIAPHFRQNDYYAGLAAGVTALTVLLDQEHFPAPANSPNSPHTAPDAGVSFGSWWPILFFVFLVGMALMRSRGPRGSSINRGKWGNSSGIILGSGIGSVLGGGFGGSGGSGNSSGGFSGGGGGFDGGGASGDW